MSQVGGLPIIVQFGCGRLAIGAVLPFLIDRYGRSHRIIVVQRRSHRWQAIPDNFTFSFNTTAGDFMPFRTVVVDPDNALLNEAQTHLLKNERRLLLLLPDLARVPDYLKILSGAALSELLISCSLGTGQAELVERLRLFSAWENVLVFENSFAEEWLKACREDLNKTAHHILVDRICWRLEPFSQGHQSVSVYCEPPRNVVFEWPEATPIPPEAKANLDPSIVAGEVIVAGWNCTTFCKTELEWRRLKKRALVNAPHALAALLSYRILIHRGMDSDSEKQYLAPLQEMLRALHPEWERAMDHYLRLRAIEVAWKDPSNPTHEQEELHAKYFAAYEKAINARRRFFSTNDRLERLVGSQSKELDNFSEHIRKPMAFYEEHYRDIMHSWIYGRPNHVDIVCLQKFLLDTFEEGARALSLMRSKLLNL